ncbi:hypothetical protein Btru_040651 [Bulinus truncatus]|nr:hypothetical protein Btru_040651 [Bulinus truncatus]
MPRYIGDEYYEKDSTFQSSLETVLFPISHWEEVSEALHLSALALSDDFFTSSNEVALKERMTPKNFVVCLEDKLSLLDQSTISFFDHNRVGDDLVIEFFTQPILSFTLLENDYSEHTDISSDFLQNLHYEKDISLLPSSFLSQEQLLSLSRKVWGAEKYYDGMQISVPFISQVKLPDVLNEATEILSISELDIGTINECLSWNIHCPNALSPSSCLSILPDNIYICESGPLELVEKLPLFDFDSIWNDAKSDEVGKNVTDEEILRALQHAVYDDSIIQFKDPLESFIHVRSKQKLIEKSDQTGCTKDSIQPVQSIITPLVPKEIDSSETNRNIKTIPVNISGDFEQVLKYIQDFAKAYIDVLKKAAILTNSDSFFEISVDKIQFLLKEYEMQKSETHNNDFSQKRNEISILQSLHIVHTLRVAAELLIHSCLETCISWITSQKEENLFNSGNDSIYVAPYTECHIQHLSSISLIVVYDESLGAYYRNLCLDNDVAYLDLITQYKSAVNLVKSNEDGKEFTASFTMICSTCITQNRQLIYLLEARYNLLVIERDYGTLGSEGRIYFADIILGVSHCIVLLSLQDINRQFDLEGSAKRFVALGMQFSYCFIILHGLSSNSSAQLLLKYLSLKDIFEKSVGEIKEIIPEMPERVLKQLCQSITELKCLNDDLQDISDISSEKALEMKEPVSTNSFSSPTYSPLLSEQNNETPPHRTPDTANEIIGTNIVSHSSSQPSQLHQYPKNFHCNDAVEISHSFKPWRESYCDGRKNELLEVLSQPHMINNDNFETHDSSEDYFGKLSFEDDEEIRFSTNSQERRNMNETKKYHLHERCRNNSQSYMFHDLNLHSAATNSNKNLFDYNSVKHSGTYNLSQRNIDNFNPEYKTLQSFHINSERSGTNYKINSPSGNGKAPVNKNMSQACCWNEYCNSLEGRNQDNSLFSPPQESLTKRGLTKASIVSPIPHNFNWNEPNLFRASDHSKSRNNEMYPWVKRNSLRDLEVSRCHEKFPKALGIVEPTSLNKHAIKDKNIPYFDRFSDKHKFMPIQPVQPSPKGYLNDNFLSSRLKQAQLSGSYCRTTAHNTELSQFNNSLTREVKQPDHKVKSALPYIPRQNVCVGLATPLRKQTNEVDDVYPPQMNTSTEAETSDSPPLDLVDEQNLPQSTQHTTNSAKLKRWNNQLLTISGQNKVNDLRKSITVNALGSNEPLLKRRKLQVEKKAGNNGQTVLVFK